MTSALVNPAAGYITLSRLDSSRSCPSIWTAKRSGAIVVLHTLVGCLVRTQPQEPGEPQPAVRGAVAVPDLDHQLWAYPVRATGILAGHDARRERRYAGGQRRQHRQQLLLGGAADASTDPAAEGETVRA